MDETGCERFSYERDSGIATMNHRRAPDEVYDDADELRRWAALALDAGLRTPKRKR